MNFAPDEQTALVGYTGKFKFPYQGFVGQNLAQQYSFSHFYNSKNLEEIRGKSFDLVIFTASEFMN